MYVWVKIYLLKFYNSLEIKIRYMYNKLRTCKHQIPDFIDHLVFSAVLGGWEWVGL